MITRHPLSITRRAAIFTRADGRCHICEQRIKVGERWELEHRIPLALGGADDETNMAPAHVKCHARKTVADAADWSRAKRREAKHYGIRKPSRLPCGRDSKWKRTVDGRTVLR